MYIARLSEVGQKIEEMEGRVIKKVGKLNPLN